jgi:hypothetical protein
MTVDVTDMSTPVTRGELRDELTQLEHRFDDKLGHLEQRFDDKLGHLEQRFDDKLDQLERKLNNNLGLWGEALAALIRQSETRLVSELAGHTQAVYESMAKANLGDRREI